VRALTRWTAAALVTATAVVVSPGPAAAEDRSGPCDMHRAEDEPVRRFSRRLIRCAATRWPVRGGAEKAICIARRESGLNPRRTSETGQYLGLYQHDADLWGGRYAAWTRERWALNPRALNGRSNSIVTIRMASANGWGPWRGEGCTAEDLAG
jgi:hypothetical protein